MAVPVHWTVDSADDALAEIAEQLGVVAPRHIRSVLGDQDFFDSIIALAQSHAMVYSIMDNLDPVSGDPLHISETTQKLLDAVHCLVCALNGAILQPDHVLTASDDVEFFNDALEDMRGTTAVYCPGSDTVH